MKYIFSVVLIVFITLYSLFTPQAVFATQAGFLCTPSSGTYAIGDSVIVDFVLNTRSYSTYGAQVVATYTTEVADVVGSTVTPVTSVTNWSAPTTNSVDSTLGKISLDYGNSQPVFTGNTAIGRVTFKTKAAGQLELGYTFFQQYDDTTPGVAKVWGKKDSQTLSNILTDVTSCIYNISQPVIPTPTVPSALTPTVGPTSPPSTPAPTISELPRTGTVENMVILVSLGIGLIVVGGFLPSVITFLKH